MEKVWKLITDPIGKDALECKDRCYRLGGEIITIPQNEEELKYMDKVLWDLMMKKANGDVDLLKKVMKYVPIHVGGETKIEDYKDVIPNLEESLLNRKAIYPKGGYFKFYHPHQENTEIVIRPAFVVPKHDIDSSPINNA